MILGIVGTGTMGQVTRDCAVVDGEFEKIYMIEPLEENPWPDEKVDILIDFSHPEAITRTYDYCSKMGGRIAVVIATTGFDQESQKNVDKLMKICPVVKRTNFSKGVEVMEKLVSLGYELLGDKSDVRVIETHHTKKKDSPSGTAKTLCDYLNIGPDDYDEKVCSVRMGTIFGEHSVFFAMEDEVLEIKHTAFSKKIFALGAIEAGKKLYKAHNA